MNACSTAVLDISAHYITPHNRTQQFVTMTTAAESQGDALKGTKAVDVKKSFQMNEKILNEEYKIWKKTSPLLYDLLYSYSCDLPPLSVKWMKNYSVLQNESNESYINANLIVGTNSKDKQNLLRMVSVSVPPTLSGDYEKKGIASIPNNLLKSRQLKTIREWNHPGEVNKLQINHESNLVATHTNNGDVLLFDINDTDLKTHKSTLKFHSKEGFGLEWNPNSNNRNMLLSSAEDCKIALWDINHQGKLSNELKPSKIISSHDNIVNDISWNHSMSTVFASVSDDSSYQIHDLRLESGPIVHITSAHHDPDMDDSINFPINAVDFNANVSTLFATGGADNCVQVWDLRNPTIPLRRLLGHQAAVVGLKFHENYLMSTSIDNRALIWDLNKLEEGEPDRRRSDYLDPCLSFMHGGHTGKICDADWHPELENLMVSCAEDGLLEVWRPAHLGEEYIEDGEQKEEKEDENENEKQNNEQTVGLNEEKEDVKVDTEMKDA